MDKEQVQFILRSFRPDGADVNDRDFAEALAMAMENRELGEWLANERALDAAFAKSLGAVALPENLRRDILACLTRQPGDFPQTEHAVDAAMIGALASIQPPPSLRHEVLAAMDRNRAARQSAWPWLRRLAMPLAAAAGVMLALFVTRDRQEPGSSTSVTRVATGMASAAANEPVPVEVVQAGFIRAFESPQFRLDMKREDHKALLANLKSRKLPCPCCLPPGLSNIKGIGCRELTIHGKQGSLVCFEERENGVMHLMIFRRGDVCGDLPACGHPSFVQDGDWATARWEDAHHVFILIGHTDLQKLSDLF